MHQGMKFLAFVALAACGGGSSTSGEDPELSEIEILRNEASRLAAAVDARDLTDPGYTPPGGSIDYAGIATFGFLTESINGDGVGGDMTLSVDFAGNDVTGEIDNFVSRDGDAREGSMILTNGQVVRTTEGILIGADVSGTLDIVGGVKELNGALAGVAVGEEAEYVSGVIETTYPLELSGGGGTVDVEIDGAFIVESQ